MTTPINRQGSSGPQLPIPAAIGPGGPENSVQTKAGDSFLGDSQFVYQPGQENPLVDIIPTENETETVSGYRIFPDFLSDPDDSAEILTVNDDPFAFGRVFRLAASGNLELVLASPARINIRSGLINWRWATSDAPRGSYLMTDGEANVDPNNSSVLSFQSLISPQATITTGAALNNEGVRHMFVPVDSAGGAFAVSLPAASPNNAIFTIKDISGNCLANPVTITGTIGGPAVLATDRASLTLFKNAGTWEVINEVV